MLIGNHLHSTTAEAMCSPAEQTTASLEFLQD
jgi:hypothetical protein